MWCLGIFIFLGLQMQKSYSVPVVSSVSPQGVILAGGIEINVVGTGLNDAAQPRVIITGNYSSATEVFTGSTCIVITSTSLVCPSPHITLTSFQTTGYQSNDTSQLLNSQISFRIGIIWNGVNTWQDFGSIDVYKNPTLRMDHPKRTYTVWTNRIVQIFGTNLDQYVTDMSQYDVSVSNLKCVVYFLNSTCIMCLLPTSPPIPNDADDLHSLVVLKVGDFSVQLGRIWYRIPTFVNQTSGEPQIFMPNDKTATIAINGTNFMIAITSGDTYYIQIGQGECTNVTLLPNRITCRPPDIEPQPLSNFPLRDNLPQIVITVPRVASSAAHQYTEHVGYVQYSDQIVTTPTVSVGNGSTSPVVPTSAWNRLWQWVVVGFVFLLSVLLLLGMLCCFCFLPYLRRNKKGYHSDDGDSFYVRNTSAHSSFRSYDSKLTGRSYDSKLTSDTHIESDGKRFYYVTEEKIPSRNFRRY